jgi:hypothetical protein
MPDDDVDLDLLREAARDFLTGRVAQDSLKELAAMDWTGLDSARRCPRPLAARDA